MLSWSECMHEVAFTHVEPDGTIIQIAVDRLNALLDQVQCPVFRVRIDPDFVNRSIKSGMLEQHRLRRIDLQAISRNPITTIELLDQTHVIVDGNHRYVKAAMLGRKDIKTRIVPEVIWREFEIAPHPLMANSTKEELKDVLQRTYSGIV